MPHSRPWSADAERAATLLAAAALLALGLVAESQLYAWSDVWQWLPDLLTGLTVGVSGLFVLSQPSENRSGLLLTAVGFAWFAGNFVSSGSQALSWISEHGLLFHRALLVQLLLSFPRASPRDRMDQVATAAAYGLSIAATFLWTDAAAVALAVVVAIGGWYRVRASVGAARRAARYAARASVVFAVAIATVGIVDASTAQPGARRATLLGYELAVGFASVWLASGLVRRPWQRAMTDLVVDIGETRARKARDALASAIGDATVVVAYPMGDGRYVDAEGRRVEVPSPGAPRRATSVLREGEEVAVLVHDPAVLDDPALLDAVAAAARLGASNARLHAEVRAQVQALAASRRRLLEAADAERVRLERRLRSGAAARVAELARTLADARLAGGAAAEHVTAAKKQLARVDEDLRDLAAGLHPSTLSEGGLLPALRSLSERAPIPVSLSVADVRLPTHVEVAFYFVASEALANVAKHAQAKTVSVEVSLTRGAAAIEVRDDGVGVAAGASGSGLRGLSDRVEALGGSFTVESRAGEGTRLRASIAF